jgi:hypothetical protein
MKGKKKFMMNMVAACKLFFPKIKIDVERWRFNEQAQLYVSNKGRVRRKNGTLIEFKVRRDNGYISVYTKESGFWSVHQLVAQTWIPNSDPTKNTVDHLDHNKRNNRVDNLEWCTVAENRARANRDLCYDPDEADRLIEKYNRANKQLIRENEDLKKVNAKLLSSNKQIQIPIPEDACPEDPIIKCNGIAITARELSLISMAGNFGPKYAKRLQNFVGHVNENDSVYIGGMTFTRI